MKGYSNGFRNYKKEIAQALGTRQDCVEIIEEKHEVGGKVEITFHWLTKAREYKAVITGGAPPILYLKI